MRNRIAEWRRARGLTQEELAAQLEAHYTTINRLENDKQGLSEKWIMKLAGALEVHPADLMISGQTDMTSKNLQLQDEAEIYIPDKRHWTANAQLAEHQSFYRIASDALSAIDIPKGSIAIADFSADAVAAVRENGSATAAVLIQYHFDPSNFSHSLTLPRQFVPPHTAIRNSLDKRADPIIVEDESAEIIAVIASIIRDV